MSSKQTGSFEGRPAFFIDQPADDLVHPSSCSSKTDFTLEGTPIVSTRTPYGSSEWSGDRDERRDASRRTASLDEKERMFSEKGRPFRDESRLSREEGRPHEMNGRPPEQRGGMLEEGGRVLEESCRLLEEDGRPYRFSGNFLGADAG